MIMIRFNLFTYLYTGVDVFMTSTARHTMRHTHSVIYTTGYVHFSY